MSQFTDPKRLGNSGAAVARCLDEGRPALVGYYPVGYPTVPDSLSVVKALVEGTQGRGADIVEIGIPYSDPLMDGLVIQHATTKARARGVRTRDAFLAVEAVASAGATPMVMTYWNLVEAYGVDAFARDLSAAGGAGVITPDLPPDDCPEWFEASDAHDVDRVFLIAPSSTDERIALTMESCRGWVYASSVMGVTGVRSQTSDAAPVIVERARAVDPSLPIGIGLGVSDGDQAAEIGSFADLVIVGSALVKCMSSDGLDMHGDLQKLRALADDLAAGVERARR
ncbi:tryptophan synthase subunit alpha [Tessaracoccus sp. MC1865]|uniref:tryptophan synthase subunit alpha n=1 Tax=unclassified Tessaracoccus TaxID=2635419 RepID=UPI0016027562|nr:MULTISPECIES: tryptophan synthase subunit alpha [unclassified Tessaracoccus]MBB1483410.1 tryptophan synthase subunit alpha [Tessaracoccus sp. MC1865]MBB1509095.1 tryptophan synthase subunit alpha [Tessaracoccus sp. MC1756]QTO36516.1 tryptophan synthase subunit alpha [Tessaracoccus sp. MC1865]